MKESPKILVVDDEQSMCNFMEIMLKKEGYEVVSLQSAKEAARHIESDPPDLVIADMMMPEMTGLELLSRSKKKSRNTHFIMMTAFASVDSAIEAMRKGADDYITKPFKIDEIKLVIRKLLENLEIRSENEKLKSQLSGRSTLESFIGNTQVVQKLKELVCQISASNSTALILGESGTGKDLIARSIHALSCRRDKPYIAINCGAIPELLLESELFGHKKGAFTGAVRDKDGLFKAADSGVLFLDEIGNLTLNLQVKLLRVLETQEFTPVGATSPVKVDVRLLAATNANLEREVKANRFRADLFYRLHVLPILLPALRDRRDDIPLLARYFLKQLAEKHDEEPKSLTEAADRLITEYDWPGNVRELENTITRAVLLSKGTQIDVDDLPEKLRERKAIATTSAEQQSDPTLIQIEQAYIYWTLQQNNWQKGKVAKILGIDVSTLYRKIERYGLKKT